MAHKLEQYQGRAPVSDLHQMTRTSLAQCAGIKTECVCCLHRLHGLQDMKVGGDLVQLPLIAQRIARYAHLVGRENVIAGSDCGYGTWVGQAAVDPDVVWAKLAAMAEGARIASKQFWKS